MRVDNNIFFALAEERLAAGEQVRITLVGTSMQPTLCEGDVLTLAPAADAPSVGDVVLFRYRGTHLLHRIVAAEGDTYTMQGDACSSTERCRKDDVVGRLVAVEHRSPMRRMAIRWLGPKGRRQLRPWYFAALAVLMWAPLNGLDLPLDNYLLGLRADHLIHASVFLPCALFLMDIYKGKGRRWLVWLTATGVGMLSESVQWLLPWRGYDINDLVANFLGVSIGWAAILYLQGVRRRHQCPDRVTRGGCR